MILARSLSTLLAATAILIAAGAPAQAQHPLTLEDSATPHLLAMRGNGWQRGSALAPTAQTADVRVMDAQQALAERAAGARLKAVYVVGRDAGHYQVLVVDESVLGERRAALTQLIALHERARAWLIGNPREAAALVGAASGITAEAAAQRLAHSDLHVARPGPALAQALAAANPAAGNVIAELLDDTPLRDAVRLDLHAAPTSLASLR